MAVGAAVGSRRSFRERRTKWRPPPFGLRRSKGRGHFAQSSQGTGPLDTYAPTHASWLLNMADAGSGVSHPSLSQRPIADLVPSHHLRIVSVVRSTPRSLQIHAVAR